MLVVEEMKEISLQIKPAFIQHESVIVHWQVTLFISYLTINETFKLFLSNHLLQMKREMLTGNCFFVSFLSLGSEMNQTQEPLCNKVLQPSFPDYCHIIYHRISLRSPDMFVLFVQMLNQLNQHHCRSGLLSWFTFALPYFV